MQLGDNGNAAFGGLSGSVSHKGSLMGQHYLKAEVIDLVSSWHVLIKPEVLSALLLNLLDRSAVLTQFVFVTLR